MLDRFVGVLMVDHRSMFMSLQGDKSLGLKPALFPGSPRKVGPCFLPASPHAQKTTWKSKALSLSFFFLTRGESL